jgi:hypothetical protein
MAAAGLLLLVAPGVVSAQVVTMRDVVDLLVTNQSVQTGDFVKDQAAADAASAALGQALLVSLTTLPTSASSAGFTYRFNPSLGTLERTTTSFGPSFVERAVTSGSGRVVFGTTWQYTSFTRLDGRDLQDEGLVTTANWFRDEPTPFDVERLTFTLRSNIVTGFATVGLTDHIDLAVAVPYVWLDLDGTRIDTYRGSSFLQAQATASSTGFGDVAVRPESWASRRSNTSTSDCTAPSAWAGVACPTRLTTRLRSRWPPRHVSRSRRSLRDATWPTSAGSVRSPPLTPPSAAWTRCGSAPAAPSAWRS